MKQTLLIMAFFLAFFSACNKADDSSVNDTRIDYSVSKKIMKKAAPKPHFMTWENMKNTVSDIKTNLDRS